MIITKIIQNSDDIFSLEKKPHHCDFFSEARYNELLPILMGLYNEELIVPLNLSPYTVINTAIEFHNLTFSTEHQSEDSLIGTLNQLSISERTEYTDPIWSAKRDEYKYNPTNENEHATILGAIYYISCFSPDFYEKETLLNLCQNKMTNDTMRQIFGRFKSKADSIINEYVENHPKELAKAGLTSIGFYWLPDIEKLLDTDNIEEELERIDMLGQKGK